jgi:tripeptidyl-peptidase-2
MLHLLQLVPKQNQKGKHAYSFLLGDGSFGNPSSEEQIVKKHFSVRANLTLELCLAQFWSALGKHVVNISLNFHGVQITGNLANGQSTVHLEPHLSPS